MTTDADRAARERLAREARETATTLLDWVGTRVEGTRTDGGERPRQSPGPCTWCPVCALVAALRGEQPELTATLAEQASGLLVLLRLLVQSHTAGAHDHHAPEPTPPAGWSAAPADVPWDIAPHAMFDPAPTARATTAHAATAQATTPTAPAAAHSAGADTLRDAPADPTARRAADPAAAAPDVDDLRPAPDRPTGRRGPRPSPRHPAGTPTAPEATGPPVRNAPGPAVGHPPAAAVAPGPPVGNAPGPAVVTTPAVRNASAGTRREVQRIPVRRRPRPC